MLKGDTALDMRGRCSAGQKVCIFVVFRDPPLPALMLMPLLRNLIYLYFRPAFSVDSITEMKTPSEKESFETKV